MFQVRGDEIGQLKDCISGRGTNRGAIQLQPQDGGCFDAFTESRSLKIGNVIIGITGAELEAVKVELLGFGA
jgi:hypothetical protein